MAGGAVVILLTLPFRAQSPPDGRSVEAFYAEWFSVGAKSPEAYAGFYAADGTVLPPGQAPVTGRGAIAEWLRSSQAGGGTVTKPEGIAVDEVRFLSPTLVAHRSTLRGRRLAKDSGAAAPFETKYFDILSRTDSGRWEVVYRMWSDNR
jgi:uncharacterized protein (TIGR02246 family)